MKFSQLLFIFLLLIASCENAVKNKKAFEQVRPQVDKMEFEDNLEKLETVTYLAKLEPVNSSIAGEAYGSFTFHKNQDFIAADVRFNDSAPITTQIQKVHIGNTCPTEADDTNNDGYIDVIESAEVTGKVIIPLDNDIGSQYGLLGSYPISDAWGSYIYSKTASFKQFYQDLFDVDINPDDEVIKMTSPLGLIGKTVLVYGTDENIVMPETVATNNGLTPNQTLPIACGVITLVTEIPGTFEPDDITIGHVPGPEPGTQTISRPRPTRPGSNPGTSDSETETPQLPDTNEESECSSNNGKGC